MLYSMYEKDGIMSMMYLSENSYRGGSGNCFLSVRVCVQGQGPSLFLPSLPRFCFDVFAFCLVPSTVTATATSNNLLSFPYQQHICTYILVAIK
jgi:hypothetical protein